MTVKVVSFYSGGSRFGKSFCLAAGYDFLRTVDRVLLPQRGRVKKIQYPTYIHRQRMVKYVFRFCMCVLNVDLCYYLIGFTMATHCHPLS